VRPSEVSVLNKGVLGLDAPECLRSHWGANIVPIGLFSHATPFGTGENSCESSMYSYLVVVCVCVCVCVCVRRRRKRGKRRRRRGRRRR
jgi:hypothetical protein